MLHFTTPEDFTHTFVVTLSSKWACEWSRPKPDVDETTTVTFTISGGKVCMATLLGMLENEKWSNASKPTVKSFFQKLDRSATVSVQDFLEVCATEPKLNTILSQFAVELGGRLESLMARAVTDDAEKREPVGKVLFAWVDILSSTKNHVIDKLLYQYVQSGKHEMDKHNIFSFPTDKAQVNALPLCITTFLTPNNWAILACSKVWSRNV